VTLTERIAIVTGANHGIGAATARLLAARGAAVLLSAFGEPDLATVVETIRQTGGRAAALAADLRDPATPPRLFDAAEAVLGPVDILINNASAGGLDTFSAASIDRVGRDLRRLSAETIGGPFDVDARGSALMIAEFARRHIARGATWGRIVGLTSGGPLGFPGEVSYGAAKAALHNYAMSAALELAEFGITSNVVHPPVTDTGWVNDAVREFVRTSREHFHVATPEDVAEVIVYLTSDAARLITANVLYLR
jgi:3-oxoacyl-[acyl-carrier protein] reductase